MLGEKRDHGTLSLLEGRVALKGREAVTESPQKKQHSHKLITIAHGVPDSGHESLRAHNTSLT